MDLDKLHKEVNTYKDYPKKKLRKVIRDYKYLLFWARPDVNFTYTFLCMQIPQLFFGFSLFQFIATIIIHYLYFWKYQILNCGNTIVTEQHASEIRYILQILESWDRDKS